ncbi:MAG TPA: BTAD domain-containing putative transcriptional regulator, partial [Actinocrinis sp.]
MLALARAGRQAEALEAYQRARRTLVDELGIEPGPQLRRLQERVLAGDEELAAPAGEGRETASAVAAAAPAAPVPRQLPAAVRHFTGRQAELDALTRLAGEPGPADAAGGAVVISAIRGTAGVGKTALAVHWARAAADRFPDGQLYVDLRGYDAELPLPATVALAGFLRALGVPGPEIGPDEQQRAAQYRSLLAGRRMLVLLDNAHDAEQVRPLLPGADGCVALVTSRDSLAGLVVRDGAVRLDLDTLPPTEAVALLQTLIGPRADAAPEAARTLAGQCCGLPLALRIAAELAVTRPDDALDALVGELADRGRRLDLLDAGGDPRAAVRPVLSWSYRHLEPGAARAFRLAGLHPGPDLERHAAAALDGTDAQQADRLLGRLAQAHLIQADGGAARYTMHDLLRAYARELAAAEPDELQPRAALTRLFDLYLHAAVAAMAVLYPAEADRLPHAEPPPAGTAVPMPDEAAARAWLEVELPNLVAAVRHAAGHGWPTHATRLALTLFRHLDISGRLPEAAYIHEYARRAADETGDAQAQAAASSNLGVLEWRRGRYKAAADHFLQALASSRASGDRDGQIRALGNLGLADLLGERYQQAAERLDRALALFRERGDR